MYYVIKVGDKYLSNDGTFADDKSNALIINRDAKHQVVDDAVGHDKGTTPRFVKIRD